MNPSTLSVIASAISVLALGLGVWNAWNTFRWRKEDEESKRPNVQVEGVEWVERDGELRGLRITLNNHGHRPARNVSADLRMLDYHMKQRPAPDFHFSTANDLPPGGQFTQETEWYVTQAPVSRVMVLVRADDPSSNTSCPPATFYFVWGEPSPTYDKMPPQMPFRPMTRTERQETDAHLAGLDHARVEAGRTSILMIPAQRERQEPISTH